MKHLAVYSPLSNALLATLEQDSAESLSAKIHLAQSAPFLDYEKRAALLQAYGAALKSEHTRLAELVRMDAGKTKKDAEAEVNGAADIILKTINDATLPDFQGMKRQKIRTPVGIVGLITSFNFPVAVAHWTIAPALLAGNKLVWKPSEKTPLVALACKEIFDRMAGEYKDALHVIIGGRDLGEALVSDESVDMISATGSVAMGEAIKRRLALKKNNAIPPILELGGNNAVVISGAMNDEHLSFAVASILQSFLASSGQRCTNTRRLIVHKDWLAKTVTLLKQSLEHFIANDLLNPDNSYNYITLIDDDARGRMEKAKAQAAAQGAEIFFGGKGEPALAVLPSHSEVMHHETFAPLLFITGYDGDMEAAMKLVNAPENAGLVNGLYSLSARDAQIFVAQNAAGHSVINSPKGTGTPAFGMGFGGNKASGEGEILNATDPLRPFVKAEGTRRIAINSAIALT